MMADISYDFCPPVLVFADTPEGMTRASASVCQAGGRIGAALPLESALSRLEEQGSKLLVVADVTQDHGALLDSLLDHLESVARNDAQGSVVALTDRLIDVAAARAGHAKVRLLPSANPAERLVAVRSALNDLHRERVHEGDREQADISEPVQLQQLSEEVSRIARTLAALSGRDNQIEPERDVLAIDVAAEERVIAPGAIRSIIRARRLRDQFFDPLLFADPAWDMLLDLLAARLEKRQVAVSSLCIAAAVPPTTALRWIKSLTEEGLFVRVADPQDRRRVFIALSQRAADGMIAYFRGLERAGLAPAP